MNAHFRYTVLISSDFSCSRLSGASFFKADIRNANFFQADLFNVEFNGADLRGTNFLGAQRIHNASFSEAICNEKTIWPVNFSPNFNDLIFI
jgi:uncharacterized protein YjbI with pentapeptide repeats